MCLKTRITGPVHRGFKTSISRPVLLSRQILFRISWIKIYRKSEKSHLIVADLIKKKSPWTCWTWWDSHGPTSQNCAGPPGWHPSLLLCQLHWSALCHLQTFWGATWCHSPLLIKILKGSSSDKNLWVTTLFTGLPLDRPPLTETLCPSRQFLIHYNHVLPSCLSVWREGRCVGPSKALQKSR